MLDNAFVECDVGGGDEALMCLLMTSLSAVVMDSLIIRQWLPYI